MSSQTSVKKGICFKQAKTEIKLYGELWHAPPLGLVPHWGKKKKKKHTKTTLGGGVLRGGCPKSEIYRIMGSFSVSYFCELKGGGGVAAEAAGCSKARRAVYAIPNFFLIVSCRHRAKL